jgi:hypothetical protein
MNEKVLRAEAAKLGVTDEGWAILKADGCVEDALGRDFDEDKVSELIKGIGRIRAQLGVVTRTSGNSSGSAEDGPDSLSGAHPGAFAVDLADAERERALLFLEAQARSAATVLRVQEFRNLHRPDGPLAPEDAEQLLTAEPPGLESLSSYLRGYYGWHEGEAKWWVLTEETPSARPVRVSWRSADTLDAPNVYLITIEAPPWISPATFQGAFTEMRRRMHTERKPPKARSLRVVRFVEKLRNGSAAENSTFREMWRRWNEEYPGDAFPEARSFERAYTRTVGVLHRQYNTEIERAQTPELRRQYARARKLGSRQF